MAGLTPEEQHFFESGGDTSKLGVDPIPNAPPEPTPPSPVDLAGLGNTDPPAPAPAPVAAPAPAPAPVIQPPAADPQADFLRNQLAAAQQQAANLAAQLEAAKAPKQPEVPAPNPETDPLGSMLHQLDRVNKNVADLQAQLAEQQNQQAQLSAFTRFQQQVQTLRDQFATTTPDFQAAYSHLRENRMADLRALGLQEADVTRTIFQEEVNLSQAALQQGKNPAETIYEMAKRHGYVKSATQTPASAPSVAPAAAATNKLANLKAGLQAAPPTLPRTPVTEEITVEALRDASDADLNKLVTDPNAWAKIAGKDHIPI